MNKGEIIVAISGASGTGYGYELLKTLHNLKIPTILVMSATAERILAIEDGILPEEMWKLATKTFKQEDFTACIASGSYQVRGMVVCPCSSKTLALIGNGISLNLISRAAMCQLKERRPLILVHRETPLSLQDIENLKQCKLAGASILPASPGFYHKPKTIKDLQLFIVGKILDQLKIPNTIYKRWKGQLN